MKNKALFHTIYRLADIEDTAVSTCFYAESIEDAYGIAARRGIGEFNITPHIPGIKTEPVPPCTVEDLGSDQLLHTAVFCSWIGIKSGALSVDEVLSDTGMVHEIMHYRTVGKTISGDDLLRSRLLNLINTTYNIEQ